MMLDRSAIDAGPGYQAHFDFGGDLFKRFVHFARDTIAYSYDNVVSKLHDGWNENEREYYAKVDWDVIDRMRKRGMPTFDDPIALPTVHTFVASRAAALFQLWHERRPRFPLRARNANQELEVKKMEVLLDWQGQRNRLDQVQLARYIIADIYGYAPRRTIWDEKNQTNVTYPWDPYQWYWDPDVPADRVQQGQFMAFQSTQSMIALHESDLYFNLKDIKPPADPYLKRYGFGIELSSSTSRAGSVRDRIHGIEPAEVYRGRGIGISSHILHELLFKMIPREWFKGKHEELYRPDMDPEEPAIAVIAVANGETLIRFDYLDDYRFPGTVLGPLADMLITAPPSMVGLNSGIQRTADWLVNSNIEDVKRNLNGIWVYDPARINGALLTNRVHGMNIPLRKQAFNTPITEAIFQLPANEVTAGFIDKALTLIRFAERDTGATEPVQGASSTEQRGRTATELSIIAQAAKGRHGMTAQLYDQQDSEDLIMQMYQNTKRYMRKSLQLKLTADIADLAKMNPKINTHFTVTPGEFENIEIEYVPFDAKSMIQRERAADIKLKLFEMMIAPQNRAIFEQRVDFFRLFRSIVIHDLGEGDFDQYVIDQPGPEEQAGVGAPGPAPGREC